MEWTFSAEVWLWKSDATWHFVTLPESLADEIEDRVPHRAGFGSVPVSVELGSSRWKTSIFPSKEAQSFILPIKKSIRQAESVGVGDRCSITIRVDGNV